MWQTRSHAQPQRNLCQHHGRISCQNAQNHLALNFRPHSTQSLPPETTSPSSTSAQPLLPSWRHGLATTNPSRTVRWNATDQRHLPPANNHHHAVYQPGQGMMMNVGQYPQGTGNMPMMHMGQQPTAAPMLMNHYAPTQQSTQMPGYFG
jgi:hypothetical protein